MKQLILILCVGFWLTSCQKDEYEKINNQTVIFIFPYSADMNGYFQKNINDIETAMKNGAFFNEFVGANLRVRPQYAVSNEIDVQKMTFRTELALLRLVFGSLCYCNNS